ncbi:hypothetical protein SDC9_154789 [bioreactor metagenome]|uniref:Uncharacterized protein n=1 Tax=bioreactor metagenome TaxID=1076179 RepID=A0A645F265_9ZZZZ
MRHLLFFTDGEQETFLSDEVGDDGNTILQHIIEGEGNALKDDAVFTEPGEFQDVVDDGLHRLCCRSDAFDIPSLVCIKLGLFQEVAHPTYPVERGTDLVRNACEKPALLLVRGLCLPLGKVLLLDGHAKA